VIFPHYICWSGGSSVHPMFHHYRLEGSVVVIDVK
jgi:hypothetical protein